MIILDEEEDQLPKIARPPPVRPVVRRPGTPTPSLPDYETSQEQEQQKAAFKRKPMSKRLKWTIYGLIAYFVVTVAIGIPLIVVVCSISSPVSFSRSQSLGQKTRHDEKSYKSPSMLYPSPPASGSSNGTGLAGFNLGETSICVDAATACNQWSSQDKEVSGTLQARYVLLSSNLLAALILSFRLQYLVPVSSTVFVQSNVSCLASQAGPITGSLNLGINTDSSVTQITVKVKMSYSGAEVREKTSVCLMNLENSDGLYIYVRHTLLFHSVLSELTTVSGPREYDDRRVSRLQYHHAVPEAQ